MIHHPHDPGPDLPLTPAPYPPPTCTLPPPPQQVVRMDDVGEIFDPAGIQPFSINNHKVLFLRPRINK